MDVKLQFFGAARNVTGSCYLLEHEGKRILVDCGLYQERDLQKRNWDEFPVPASSIDAVLLTHAHLDHCGRLPKLVKEGFRGPIHTTSATAEIAGIVMLDSARIQEEDIKYKQKRHRREGRSSPYPYEPLYTTEDCEETIKLLAPVEYEQQLSVGGGITAEFFDAGHIFGSSMIKVGFNVGDERRSIIFSGDVGRENLPILRDPSTFKQADYILVESTYGDRLHEPAKSIPDELEKVVNRTMARGGNIIIPSFAIERTQEVLYHLNTLLSAGRIPSIPVFVDSPMAIRVTEVFQRHPDLFDADMRELIRQGQNPCEFEGLSMSRTVNESKAIANVQGSAIIIAGSGMCNGGRVKHHLKANIVDPASTVLFVGYQAVGTLGRHIVDGADEVRIHGGKYKVAAEIAQLSGFSAHADRDEMSKWLSSLENHPRKIFIVHGEEKQALSFAEHVQEMFGWETLVPEYEQSVVLD
jgi:metallo-beta-lactamase family protein